MGVNLVDFFDVVPTSLWLENYNDLHRFFVKWRAAGATDLQRSLEEDVSRVVACSVYIKVLRANRRMLSMYATLDVETPIARLTDVLHNDMLEVHVDELVQLWSGESSFGNRSVNYTLGNRRLNILLKGVAPPDRA